MKYSEFERTVKSMGLFLNDREGEIYVEDDSQFPVLTVSKLDEMVIDTEYPSFIELPYGKKDTLLILVVTLAKTPLAEREEEKKYHLKLELPIPLEDSSMRWLNQKVGASKYHFGSQENISDYKTIFTESEVAQMDLTGLKLIEVKK